jgi:very-short-patch-repair endonuclease
MNGFDDRVFGVASDQRYLVTRDEVLEIGGSDELLESRLGAGVWLKVHPGVYQVDRRPLDWESKLLAAVLAAGPEARASHRAALLLWGLDGIGSAPLEVTMPFGNLAFPSGAVVHRSRRATPRNECRGIPVSGPERALLECSSLVPPIIVGKALDSAIRHSITTIERLWLVLASEGGRGVKGTRRLRSVLRQRDHDTATDSGSEFELLHHMQQGLLPRPELGFELYPDGNRRIPDFIWPDRGKAVEVDGIDAHSSADRLDDDLRRQNQLMDLGLEIRRFSARQIRRDPKGVVEEIRRFLES